MIRHFGRSIHAHFQFINDSSLIHLSCSRARTLTHISTNIRVHFHSFLGFFTFDLCMSSVCVRQSIDQPYFIICSVLFVHRLFLSVFFLLFFLFSCVPPHIYLFPKRVAKLFNNIYTFIGLSRQIWHVRYMLKRWIGRKPKSVNEFHWSFYTD